MSVTIPDRDLSKLNPKFMLKVEELLAAHPEIFVTEAYRSAERQKYLYEQGRTRSGAIITYVDGYSKKSMHQSGNAIDIAFRGIYLYPSEHSKWESVGDTASELGIDWGYSLWGWDKVHFQNNEMVVEVVADENPESDWASDSWDWASSFGVLNGTDPQGVVTREMLAQALYNYDNSLDA